MNFDPKTVKVGERVGGLWIVEKGLEPGERVVAQGGGAVPAGRLGERVGGTPLRPRPLRRVYRCAGDPFGDPADRRADRDVAEIVLAAGQLDRSDAERGQLGR